MTRMSEPTGASTNPQSSESGGASPIAEKAQQVQQNLRDLGGQVRDSAQHAYEQTRDRATEYYQQGRQSAEEWEHSLEEYVRQKPIQSLLIAAGAGLVLGMLWKRS